MIGLEPAIKLSGCSEFHQFLGDDCFAFEAHRQVRIVPIAFNAETLELLALNINPVIGKFSAFLAELVDRNVVLILALGAILLFDLPFNRQTMAVPAGDVVALIAAHLHRAGDDVLQGLVERMADMDVAIRIGEVRHAGRTCSGLCPVREVSCRFPVFPSAPGFQALFWEGLRASENRFLADLEFQNNRVCLCRSSLGGSGRSGGLPAIVS